MIIHQKLECPIIREEEHFVYLIIENPDFFKEFTENLNEQIFNNHPGQLIISSKNKKLSPAKTAQYLTSPIQSKIQSTTALKQLYASLETQLLEREVDIKIQTLMLSIKEALSFSVLDAGAEFSKPDLPPLNDIFKLFGINFLIDGPTLVESLENYFLAVRDYLSISIFFCNQFSSYFNLNELEELRDFSIRESLVLIFLEGSEPVNHLDKIKYLIVDKDLCEIVK